MAWRAKKRGYCQTSSQGEIFDIFEKFDTLAEIWGLAAILSESELRTVWNSKATAAFQPKIVSAKAHLGSYDIRCAEFVEWGTSTGLVEAKGYRDQSTLH